VTHIVIWWRGYGLVALAVMIPILASCAVQPIWVSFGAFAFSLLFAGVICFLCATRYYEKGFDHTLYSIPLELWGCFYLGLVCLLAFTPILCAVVVQDQDDSERIMWAVVGVVGFLFACVTSILVIRSYRRKVMKTRAANEYEDFEIVE
jgi:hypothetical protein